MISGGLAGWAARKTYDKASDSRVAASMKDFVKETKDRISNSGPVQTVRNNAAFQKGTRFGNDFAKAGVIGAAGFVKPSKKAAIKFMDWFSWLFEGSNRSSSIDYDPKNPRYPGREQLLKQQRTDQSPQIERQPSKADLNTFTQQLDPQAVAELQKSGGQIVAEQNSNSGSTFMQSLVKGDLSAVKATIDQTARTQSQYERPERQMEEMGAR